MSDFDPRRSMVADLLRAESHLEAWGEHLRAAHSRSTAEAYVKAARLFLNWLGQRGGVPTSARPADVEAWRAYLHEDAPRMDPAGRVTGRGYRPKTVNLWLVGLRRFYSWMVATGRAASNPAAEVRGVQVTRNLRPSAAHLADSEVRAVLAACDANPIGRRDAAVLSLMAYCAMRPREIQRLEMDDLQSENGRKVLQVQSDSAGRRHAKILLPGPVEEALLAWLAIRGLEPGPIFAGLSNRSRGRRLGLRQIRRIVSDRFRAAGAGRGSGGSRALRRTAILNALRNGADPAQVQSLAGHSSLATTLRYLPEVKVGSPPAQELIDYSV